MDTEHPDALSYMAGLLCDPAPTGRASGRPTAPSTSETDAILRARFRGFARDIGMTERQADAVLAQREGPLGMEAFKTVLASVSVVAAGRLSREASRRAVVAEAVLAIACCGHDRTDTESAPAPRVDRGYLECRSPASPS